MSETVGQAPQSPVTEGTPRRGEEIYEKACALLTLVREEQFWVDAEREPGAANALRAAEDHLFGVVSAANAYLNAAPQRP